MKTKQGEGEDWEGEMTQYKGFKLLRVSGLSSVYTREGNRWSQEMKKEWKQMGKGEGDERENGR